MPPLATSLVRPSDSPLEVVRQYEQHGFPSQFAARPGGNVRCMSCRRDHPARWVKPLAMHHVGGRAARSGEVVVTALECPACEERGTLALAVGPSGPVEDRLVVSLLDPVESPDLDVRSA
jgi:hypothetical protein